MNTEKLIGYWRSEEEKAHIKGWDFGYIEDRYESEEDKLPWELTEVINRYRNDKSMLLDIDTGGGEFLLSLGHPHSLTCATEGYPPNVELCRKRFSGLGIEFHEMSDCGKMPFEDGRFDIITNRHGSYDAKEIYRVLKPGGVFITQQVGNNNDRELVEMLLPGAEKPFDGHDLAGCVREFEAAGFTILEKDEAYRSIRFFDTGALVWFARIIEWEFAGFSVEKCLDRLIAAESEIRQNGSVSGRIHRFYLAAGKK